MITRYPDVDAIHSTISKREMVPKVNYTLCYVFRGISFNEYADVLELDVMILCM